MRLELIMPISASLQHRAQGTEHRAQAALSGHTCCLQAGAASSVSALGRYGAQGLWRAMAAARGGIAPQKLQLALAQQHAAHLVRLPCSCLPSGQGASRPVLSTQAAVNKCQHVAI